MIENQRQYEVTKRNISNFERVIANLELNPGQHSRRSVALMKEEYQRELDKLRAELAEYERTHVVPRSA